MQVSLSEIWGTSVDFVRREAALLVPIALAILAVGSFGLSQAMKVIVAGDGGLVAIILLLICSVMIVCGAAAIRALALFPGMSVVEALGIGARSVARILPVSLGLTLLLQGSTWGIQAATIAKQAPSGTDQFMALAGTTVFFYVSARMLCFSAAIVDRDLPMTGAVQLSWSLTGAKPFVLMGCLFLFQTATEFIGIGVGSLIAAVSRPLAQMAGEPSLSMTVATLGVALIVALFSMFMAVFSAFFYRRASSAQ